MAIQNRRGVYNDFDPSKMVEGEWAVVQSGDPNSERGRSVYMAFQNGEVERMATYEDMQENVDLATESIQQTLTQNVGTAVSNANNAASAANTAKQNADAATTAANQAAQSASSAASSATSAASSANSAAQSAQQATTSAQQAATAANTAAAEAVEATSDANQATQNANSAATQASQSATDADTSAQNALAVANAAQLIADDAQQTADEARRIIEEGTVASFNGRAGAVIPQIGDYDASLIQYDTNNTVAQKIASNSSDVASATLQINAINNEILVPSGDAQKPTGDVDFTSSDTVYSPTSSETVELLTASDTWSARMSKISKMFKNIRYLLKMLGTTDISSIGNGTVTDAISELNSKTFLRFVSSGGASNLRLYNCTGTITGGLWYFRSEDDTSRNLIVSGRIRITNFVRTGANPGIEGALPIVPTQIASMALSVGYRAENVAELANLQFIPNSTPNFRLSTTETYQNAQNGTLTLIVPHTLIYVP